MGVGAAAWRVVQPKGGLKVAAAVHCRAGWHTAHPGRRGRGEISDFGGGGVRGQNVEDKIVQNFRRFQVVTLEKEKKLMDLESFKRKITKLETSIDTIFQSFPSRLILFHRQLSYP